MVPFGSTFALDATVSLQNSIAPSCRSGSQFGTR
jgi:hypothetical protein